MTRTHPLIHLEAILTVGIGGFAGSNLRFFVDSALPSTLASTVTVNVLGCLALGFLVYEGRFSGTISRPSRTVLATGFIASFTTYSTFVVDALRAEPTVALVYIGTTYILGFGAVLLGREGARWVAAAASPASEVSE